MCARTGSAVPADAREVLAADGQQLRLIAKQGLRNMPAAAGLQRYIHLWKGGPSILWGSQFRHRPCWRSSAMCRLLAGVE